VPLAAAVAAVLAVPAGEWFAAVEAGERLVGDAGRDGLGGIGVGVGGGCGFLADSLERFVGGALGWLEESACPGVAGCGVGFERFVFGAAAVFVPVGAVGLELELTRSG
jgi:hypothetical protein